MSHWDQLLSASGPEATLWPPGFAECAKLPTRSAATATTRASVRLPSVASGRRRSWAYQQSDGVPGSMESLSLETRSWGDSHADAENSPIVSRDGHARSASPPIHSQRETRSCVSGWGSRPRRGSKEAIVEGGHSLADEDSTEGSSTATQHVRRSLLSSQWQGGELEGLEGSMYVDFVGRGGASRASTFSGTSEKRRENRPDTAFPIVEPPPFLAEENVTSQLASVVSMPTIAPGSTTTSTRRRGGRRESRSLPPLAGGEMVAVASTEGGGPESAPARIEGRGDMEERLHDNDGNRRVRLRASGEGTWRSPDRAAAWSVLSQGGGSGERGGVSTDGKRKAFHNFVYRRRSPDPLNCGISVIAKSSVSDSSTCSMGGTTVSVSPATATQRGDQMRHSRRHQRWEAYADRWDRPPPGSVQSKRVYAARYPTPSANANGGTGNASNTAFTLISYCHDGRSKPRCCGEVGGGRPLKCHRCGSARIRLFTGAASSIKTEDATGTSSQAGERGTSGGGNGRSRNTGRTRRSLMPILGAENVREDRGPLRWTRGGGTPPPAVASPQGVSGGDANSEAGDAATRKTPTVGKSAAAVGAWNRGWRHRGEGLLPGRSGIPDGG